MSCACHHTPQGMGAGMAEWWGNGDCTSCGRSMICKQAARTECDCNPRVLSEVKRHDAQLDAVMQARCVRHMLQSVRALCLVRWILAIAAGCRQIAASEA